MALHACWRWTFQATGTLRMDLITEGPAALFHTFEHTEMLGFRLYPGADRANP